MTSTDQQDTGRNPAEEVTEEVIPLTEERLRVDRRIVDGRSVTVTTRPVTEEVRISEPVTHENIEIERVPVNRVVESLPEVREEGDLTVIPVVEERVTVKIELVLKEEIHLRRTRNVRPHEETVSLTRTEVDISE